MIKSEIVSYNHIQWLLEFYSVDGYNLIISDYHAQICNQKRLAESQLKKSNLIMFLRKKHFMNMAIMQLRIDYRGIPLKYRKQLISTPTTITLLSQTCLRASLYRVVEWASAWRLHKFINHNLSELYILANSYSIQLGIYSALDQIWKRRDGWLIQISVWVVLRRKRLAIFCGEFSENRLLRLRNTLQKHSGKRNYRVV